MLWQWGERHNGAFGFVAPTGRGLGKIEERRQPCRARRYRAARQAFGCNAERPEKEPHLRERQRPRACGKQGKRGMSRS